MSTEGRRHVAVALDGLRPFDESVRALAIARGLSERAGAKVIAVRVGSFEDGVSIARAEATARLLAEAGEETGGGIDVRDVPARQLGREECWDELLEGSSCAGAEAFVATAAGLGALLLVISSASVTWPTGGMVGAVARAADVPVVVVPPGVKDLQLGASHVVIALDGHAQVESAAAPACRLLRWLGASASLLHVLLQGGGRVEGVPVLARDRAALMLQRSAIQFGACGLDPRQIHAVVRYGPTCEVIVDQLRRERAMLGFLPIASDEIGSRRPHGVTNAVLAATPVPIVLFRSGAGVSAASAEADRSRVAREAGADKAHHADASPRRTHPARLAGSAR